MAARAELVEIDVVDNCFLWPMTNAEVAHAFEERVIDIQARTRDFRVANGDDTTLPLAWPLSVFSNPEEPRALYVAKETSSRESSFLGFLEVKMHARDYAKVNACVVLSEPRTRHGLLAVDITRRMFDVLVDDCVAMDIPTITIPRNWTDYKKNEEFTSARYNFSTDDMTERRRHTTEMCIALSRRYPYLVFKTPFKMQYIIVTPQSVPFIDRFVELFLNGPRNRTFDVYRTYNVSLWRVEEHGITKQLTPLEVDIIVVWQRKQIAHQALELERGTGRPLRIFGKTIILAPEDPDRLVIVGARRRIDIPPEAVRAENNLWQDALTVVAEPRYREPEVNYFSQVNTQDTRSRETRAHARQQEADQVTRLEARIAAQHRLENPPREPRSAFRRRGQSRQPRNRSRTRNENRDEAKESSGRPMNLQSAQTLVVRGRRQLPLQRSPSTIDASQNIDEFQNENEREVCRQLQRSPNIIVEQQNIDDVQDEEGEEPAIHIPNTPPQDLPQPNLFDILPNVDVPNIWSDDDADELSSRLNRLDAQPVADPHQMQSLSASVAARHAQEQFARENATAEDEYWWDSFYDIE